MYNWLLETLDLLQRNAYFAVRDKVWDTVENRLPAELIADVVERVLEAEDIPSDLRVIVDFKGDTGHYPKKSLSGRTRPQDLS